MLLLLAAPALVVAEAAAAAAVEEVRQDRVSPALHTAAAEEVVVEVVMVAQEPLVLRLPLPTAALWLHKPFRSVPKLASPPRPPMLAAT